MKPLDSGISLSIKTVLANIEKAMNSSIFKQNVQLVAVSKTKSVENIMEAYETGLRHFGENYVEELVEKSKKLPSDIKWHFIGHLQSNKCKNLLSTKLEVIESIDSAKLAAKVQKACDQLKIDSLNVFVQVKTSQELTKSGITDMDSLNLVEYILKDCPRLKFSGLMTIGEEGDINAFKQLRIIKEEICEKLKLNATEIQLSMGMSADYEQAILEGSTNVRVGSKIFGERVYNKN